MGNDPGLDAFNRLPDAAVGDELQACCTSRRWIRMVAAQRPYPGREQLFSASDQAVGELAGVDLDEALAGHPRIGERVQPDSWSAGEQRGMDGATDDVQARIAAGNREYEERFGHVYLVCATGKSAEELLGILFSRLGNDPDTERAVTKGELAQINRIRLAALLDQLAGLRRA